MSRNTWVECVAWSQADGTALTNSLVRTSIIPLAAVYTFPANTLKLGHQIRVKARGRISTVVTTPGTMTFDFSLGGTAVSAFGAISLNTTAQTNATWALEFTATCRAESGSSSNFIVIGEWYSRAVLGSAAVGAGGIGAWSLPDTAPAVGSNVDTTTALATNLNATWSVNNASNSILCHQFTMELMQ